MLSADYDAFEKMLIFVPPYDIIIIVNSGRQTAVGGRTSYY